MRRPHVALAVAGWLDPGCTIKIDEAGAPPGPLEGVHAWSEQH